MASNKVTVTLVHVNKMSGIFMWYQPCNTNSPVINSVTTSVDVQNAPLKATAIHSELHTTTMQQVSSEAEDTAIILNSCH